jgi:DnaK suppressor protein
VDESRARTLLAEERTRVEEALRQRRQEQATDIDADELAAYDQHQADGGSELYERERAEGSAEELEDRLRAIARAEERLAAGTYGVSVESGAPIPEERLEALPWAERTAEEESAGRHVPEYASGVPDDDDSTPLDVVEPDPVDLAAIPLSETHEPVYDPQEDGDEVALDMPGQVYTGEGAAPSVGVPDPDDPAVERNYRPD